MILRRVLLAGAVLALVAGGIRLVVMERVFPVKPLGDEVYYALVASSLADGAGHVYGASSVALRPPAQAWVLSLVTDPDALRGGTPGARGSSLRLEGLRPLLRLEVVLGTALVLATALLGLALFDARTGLLAGAVAAAYPTFVAYSHFLWSETLFALLVTLALAALATSARRSSAGLAALAGLCFGAATLAREIALPVAGVGALWIVTESPRDERRAAAARAALLLACAVVVVLPWTLRNARELGRFVPVSTVGWLAIGEGNSLEGARWLHPSAPARGDFRREILAVEGEVERMDAARARTLEIVAEAQPGWLPRKLAHNVPLMLSPDAFQLYKLRNGSYGDVGAGVVAGVTAATAVSYAIVAAAAIVGIACVGGGRRRLALLVFGVVAAVHVVANANSRFRMPWMPLAMSYAAWGALRGRAAWRGTTRSTRVFAFVWLVLLGVVCVSFFVSESTDSR